jgi:tetraacyldisaccharide 4'-kinase
VLSRGYKRKSKGYVLADADTSMSDIGDEPYQMKKKFPDIYIAVDKNRCEGIDNLTQQDATKDTDVVLLDDAFQHRYVKPGVNILLVDYHRLIISDKLLPAGRLREPKEGKARADIVIITKCPKDLKAINYRMLTRSMNLFTYQSLFFTTLEYGELFMLFGNEKKAIDKISDQHVLLLTGIASPQQMILDLEPLCLETIPLAYSDHHDFKAKDIARINQMFEAMPAPKMIITTEKDAARLETAEGLNDEVRNHLYVLPVEIKFMQEQEKLFNHKILSYVQKNSRNSILVKNKDEHKSEDSHHSGNGSRTISFRNY